MTTPFRIEIIVDPKQAQTGGAAAEKALAQVGTAAKSAGAAAKQAAMDFDGPAKKLPGFLKMGGAAQMQASKMGEAVGAAAGKFGVMGSAIGGAVGAFQSFAVGGPIGAAVFILMQLTDVFEVVGEQAIETGRNIADFAISTALGLDSVADALAQIEEATKSNKIRGWAAESSAAFDTFNESIAVNEGAASIAAAEDAFDGLSASVAKFGRDVAGLPLDEQERATSALAKATRDEADALAALNVLRADPVATFHADVAAQENANVADRAAKYRQLAIEVQSTGGYLRAMAQINLDNIDAGIALVNRLTGATKNATYQAGIASINQAALPKAMGGLGLDIKAQQAAIKALHDETYGKPAQRQVSEYQRYIDGLTAPMKALVTQEGYLSKVWTAGGISLAEYEAETRKLADARERLTGERPVTAFDAKSLSDAPTVDELFAVADAKAKDAESQAAVNSQYRDYVQAMLDAGAAADDAKPKIASFADIMQGEALGQISSGVDQLSDQFAELATGGETSFRAMADSMIKDIERIVAKQALLAGIRAIGGMMGGKVGGGGFADGLASMGLPGFATGGRMQVGAGGPDSQLAMFRVSPNENITIQTPEQIRASEAAPVNVGGPRINNNMDPGMVLDVLGSGSGERAVMNMITRNAGAIRRVLR